MRFRSDIEGLRAIAVALVVLYHYVPGLMPGGYVGVDVFFVISGFLITGSLVPLLRDRSSVAPVLAAFLARRVRRLLPNALLAVLGVAAAGLIWWPDPSLQQLGGQIAFAATYSINWLFVRRATDYWQWDEALSTPLLHYWSLAVEEQFYLAWPLLLVVVCGVVRARARSRAWHGHGVCLAAVLGLVSLVYCVTLSRDHLTLAFFSSLARAWELFLGAALGLWTGMRGREDGEARGGGVTVWSAQWMGLALIGAAALAYSEATRHPGWPTLVPTLGTALLLMAGWRAGPHAGMRVLAHPWLAYLGSRSYAIYLWHWPVLVFERQVLASHAAWLPWVAVASTLVLAEASYRWIEVPARFSWGRNLSALRVIGWGVVCSLAVAAMGVGIKFLAFHGIRSSHLQWSASEYKTLERPSLARLSADLPQIYVDGCHATLEETEAKPCSFGSAPDAEIAVLLGDSHAAQWFPAVFPAAQEAGQRLVVMTKSSCPIADVTVWSRVLRGALKACDVWREAALSQVDGLRPRIVVVSNLVDPAMQLVDRRTGALLEGKAAETAFEEGMVRTLIRLGRANAKVVVMQDTPRQPEDLLDCFYSRSDPRPCGALLPARSFTLPVDVRAARRTGSAVWDFTSQICPEGRCQVLDADSKVAVYRDVHHLTASYVRRLAPQVTARWTEELIKQSPARHQVPD